MTNKCYKFLPTRGGRVYALTIDKTGANLPSPPAGAGSSQANSTGSRRRQGSLIPSTMNSIPKGSSLCTWSSMYRVDGRPRTKHAVPTPNEKGIRAGALFRANASSASATPGAR
jgi:hypothetical protein